MKTLFFIMISFLSISCLNFEENKDFRLTLKIADIKEVYLKCFTAEKTVSINYTENLINKINSAKCIGPVKGIVTKRLIIVLNNNDTINLRLLGNHFKWNKSADWAYELNIEKSYFEKICKNKD